MAKVLKMYKMKPIIDSTQQISVSKCMYKMKNIHEQNESINHVQVMSPVLDISEQNNEILPEMAELEQRQKKILDQLEILKNQMQNLRSELKLCAKPEQLHQHNVKEVTNFTNFKNLQSISIKASTRALPYFLLAVKKLWENQLQLVVTVHTHSSVSNLPDNAQTFSKQLESVTSGSSLPQLHISLIWKDVKFNTELMVSSMRAPVIGETNILRYLARLDPNKFEYELDNDLASTLIQDKVLDMCYYISRSKTKTERQTILRNLNGVLGKSNWMAGTWNISIADIALYSVLNQIEMTSDLTVNVSKWLQRCQTYFII